MTIVAVFPAEEVIFPAEVTAVSIDQLKQYNCVRVLISCPQNELSSVILRRRVCKAPYDIINQNRSKRVGLSRSPETAGQCNQDAVDSRA